MGNFIYKCVSLSLKIKSDDSSLTKSASNYERVLNEAAKDGWEFVKIDSISNSQLDDNLNLQPNLIVDITCTKVFIFKKEVPKFIDSVKNNKIDLVVTQAICPSCQNEISLDDFFCENCGNKLK